MDLSSLKALILAGGLGTRLRAAVSDRPKGLAPVVERPFLEHLVLWLRDQGIIHFVFCLGYRANEIMAYFGDGSPWQVRAHYSLESSPLGTGGALRLARPHVTDTFLALNGDTYFFDPIQPMLQKHRETGALFTMGLGASGPNTASGQVVLNTKGRIVSFLEKTSASVSNAWLNAGLYIVEPAFLDIIPPGRCSLEREILPNVIASAAPIYGFPLPNGYLDMGTPEGLAKLEEILQSQ